MVSLLCSFVLIIFCLFFKSEIWKVKFEIFKRRRKKCCCLKISFVRTGFLAKVDDKKGHVFELPFSDELYNFARGGEKEKYFWV